MASGTQSAPVPGLGEIGEGPIFPSQDPRGKKIWRRVRNITIETLAFLIVTVLLPVLLLIALLIDLVYYAIRRQPFTTLRLTVFLWRFLFAEMIGLAVITWLYVGGGGKRSVGSERSRRGVYNLRVWWARWHMTGITRLFGLKIEIDGLEKLQPGPILIMIRHASIIDNMVGDTYIAHHAGVGIRYVIKRELQMIPVIDIGGRWVPTIFLHRESEQMEQELTKIRSLAEDIGPGEAMIIYPEGTRYTEQKLARVKEKLAANNPELSRRAESIKHTLPPRIAGPAALLEESRERGVDVILCAHVGLDGFQYISDIWRGGLVGSTVRIKIWRVPHTEIPASDQGEEAMTGFIYSHWQDVDDWIGEQRADLGLLPKGDARKPGEPIGSA